MSEEADTESSEDGKRRKPRLQTRLVPFILLSFLALAALVKSGALEMAWRSCWQLYAAKHLPNDPATVAALCQLLTTLDAAPDAEPTTMLRDDPRLPESIRETRPIYVPYRPGTLSVRYRNLFGHFEIEVVAHESGPCTVTYVNR